MSIFLNCLPAPKMEGEEVVNSYEHTDSDKKREELKSKIELVPVEVSTIELIKKAESVVRVRFEKVRPEEPEPEEPK